MSDDTAPTVSPIEAQRLRLVWMSPEFMKASLAGRLATAERLLGAALPDSWPGERESAVLRLRTDQIRLNPAAGPWLLRAMVQRSTGSVIGYINFHDPPIEGRAELGYTVFEEHRRLGYATEAALAMMRWARQTQGIEVFVVSISPSNAPSLAMAAKLGFERVGTQIDEVDGEEWVFELRA